MSLFLATRHRFLFMCLWSVCRGVCVCMRVHIEDRSQSGISFLRNIYLGYFDMGSLTDLVPAE